MKKNGHNIDNLNQNSNLKTFYIPEKTDSKFPKISPLAKREDNKIFPYEPIPSPELQVKPSPYNDNDYTLGKKAYEVGNYLDACKYLEKARKNSYFEASYYLGSIYLKGDKDIKADKPKAAIYFEETIAKIPNHTRSMNKLGLMLELGNGIEMNLQKALKLYKKSADLNDAEGLKRWTAHLKK